jgi:2-dehydro-3-deoxyphosphogluconate aldolase/(4S)-4-hydroxy-2-oxoglutarate aldolase
MARFSRLNTLVQMRETGMVPVFYNKDLDTCKKVLKACYDGGARIFEFTNRGDRAHIVFQELITWAEKELPEMVLGVGSVVDAPTASIYIQLGANFIVSPVLNEDMAKVCNRRKVPWIPGCGSLSEISRAEELGAEVVKIFPASQVGGPAFVKAVLGPCPWSSIMPTGGVAPTEDNLQSWFNAGVTCVGMGSQLMVKNDDATFNYQAIANKTREALDIIRSLRK